MWITTKKLQKTQRHLKKYLNKLEKAPTQQKLQTKLQKTTKSQEKTNNIYGQIKESEWKS